MSAEETPGFWWREAGWQSRALAPVARLYGAAARRRLDKGARARIGVPVLCVGNFTVGGGGKTPTALALGRAAKAMGLRPGFLSRGYGGALKGPVLVDPQHHHAGAVGDEPMLLARSLPTVISADRRRGAELLVQNGIDFIVMDDGFQSARLEIDFALIVVDAGRGVGNGAVLPAGPLRAPLLDQIRHSDALLAIGRGRGAESTIRAMARGNRPVFEARLTAVDPGRLTGCRVLAFAGIADPGKFYRTLREIGADVAQTRDFPDHHPFSPDAIAELGAAAEREGLQLVTTAKDAARLAGGPAAARAFLQRVDVLEVELAFEPRSLAERILREAGDAFKRRRLGLA